MNTGTHSQFAPFDDSSGRVDQSVEIKIKINEKLKVE